VAQGSADARAPRRGFRRRGLPGYSDDAGLFVWHVTYGRTYHTTIYHGQYQIVHLDVTPTATAPDLTVQMIRLI